MKENRGYELYGLFNLREEYPGFLWCVFKKNDDFYIFDGDCNEISNFSLINEPLMINRIRPLSDFDLENEFVAKTFYEVGDASIGAWSDDGKRAILSDYRELYYILACYNFKDGETQQQVYNTLNNWAPELDYSFLKRFKSPRR